MPDYLTAKHFYYLLCLLHFNGSIIAFIFDFWILKRIRGIFIINAIFFEFFVKRIHPFLSRRARRFARFLSFRFAVGDEIELRRFR
ncbi:MAG TPA: hypothetical protein VF556_19120, partial [Pyrinomonadaceae bacterium]